MKITTILLCLLAAALPFPASAQAPAAWLDATTPKNWNTPGQTLAAADQAEVFDSRMTDRERKAETPEDQALIDAGWRLFAAYDSGWGIRILQATQSYDGMGRPWGYQAFVFVDGTLAGTLAPDPMFSRFDGALNQIYLVDASTILASFRRYTVADPLCCPSGSVTVEYRIDRGDDGPLIVPVNFQRGAL